MSKDSIVIENALGTFTFSATMTGDESAYKTFPKTWTVDSTIKAFCDCINDDASADAGMVYLGELLCSDLPSASLVNADAVVEIISNQELSGKVIHISITSGSIAPYRWEYTYWNGGSNVSGWIAFQTEVV